MWYPKALKVSIIFVYLIIVAGAVVRMTGSGMGCPDWPKCFGYYIPPTEKSDLLWKHETTYPKGAVIIRQESLKVAVTEFTTGSAYIPENWKPYTAHDYAVFNVWHTWIEYINRLVTALAGIPMLLMCILAFWYWKGRPWLIVTSWLILFLMLFQAWLGKLVVDSNLTPVKITIHMLAALAILGVLLYLWHKVQLRESQSGLVSTAGDRIFQNVALVAVLLTLIQVAMGTQVRQYVDERVMEVGYDAKSLWLDPATLWFYIHRSFSIVVVLIAIFMYYRNASKHLGHQRLLIWTLVIMGLEVFTGILMYYVDFPFGTQPIHLVLSSLLFGVQFLLFLQAGSALKRERSTYEQTV